LFRAPDSPERCRAGVLHVLAVLADEGNVGALSADLVERAATLLEVDQERVLRELSPLAESGDIVVEQTPGGSVAVYLAPLHTAEKGVADGVLHLIAADRRPTPIDTERAIAWFEQRQGIKLAHEQRQAIGLAVWGKVLVITGGPGTGKTTLINGIIQILEKKD